MQEDSGAFKTNPAQSRPIPAFRNDPESPLHRSLTGLKKCFRHAPGAFTPPICNEHRGYVAVFSDQPDSLRAGGARCVANAAKSVVTAFPVAQGPSQKPCEGGTRLSHAPRLSFSVRRDRIVDVDAGLRARGGGTAARGARGSCQ